MRSLDWESLLKSHSAFEMLDEAERAMILADDVATERPYSEGDEILAQGDIGTSVYLIGRGNADVILEKPDGEKVRLYSIGKGELFGEMALIEDRPRAATLIAGNRTLVLEIKGDAFLALMRKNAEIAIVLLERMSRRLRITDGKITDQRFCDHDEAIALLSNRIDSALSSSDASLKASQTMYDQTSRRANEIIDSADRARNTMKWSLSTAAAVLALLGGFGLWDIKQMRSGVQADREAVAEARKDLETAQAGIRAQQAELQAKSDEVEQLLARVRKSADYVREFTRNAEAELQATALLEDVRQLRFTESTLNRLTGAVDRFDTPIVNDLASALTGFLVKGKPFHPALSPVLERDGLKNPDGRLFLTYYLALSALNEHGASDAFTRYKNGLEDMILLNADVLSPPAYAAEGDRALLKRVVSRSVTDSGERASRQAEVDDLMDLILRLKTP